MAGPGIGPGTVWHEPATQVDMAPTFLGLAGIAKPPNFDGKSLVPLLVATPTPAEASSTGTHTAGESAICKACAQTAAILVVW